MRKWLLLVVLLCAAQARAQSATQFGDHVICDGYTRREIRHVNRKWWGLYCCRALAPLAHGPWFGTCFAFNRHGRQLCYSTFALTAFRDSRAWLIDGCKLGGQ